MPSIRFYSVLRGQSYQGIASLSVGSFLRHNPDARYTVFFLDTEPDSYFKSLESRGKLTIIRDSLSDYEFPGDERMGVFWYRYAVAPEKVDEDHVCQVDLDMVCMAPLPVGELSSAYLCGVSDPSKSDLLNSLDRCGWYVPLGNRRVYINAGLLSWSKRSYGSIFQKMSQLMLQDSADGVVMDSPFDDQAYINAVINNELDLRKDVLLLFPKWNRGVWQDGQLEGMEDLLARKKVLFYHVFSFAGDNRLTILQRVHSRSMGGAACSSPE